MIITFETEFVEKFGVKVALLKSAIYHYNAMQDYNEPCIDIVNLTPQNICDIKYMLPFWSEKKIKKLASSYIDKITGGV